MAECFAADTERNWGAPGITAAPGGTGRSPDGAAAAAARRGEQVAAPLEAPDPGAIEGSTAPRVRRFAESTGADLRALAAIRRGGRARPIGRADLASTRVPTLVICGGADASAQEPAAALPAGRARVVSGNHLTAIRDPGFGAAVAGFLAEAG